MTLSDLSEKLVPSFVLPRFPRLSAGDRVALLIGTGGYSGFLKPFPASWGSIVGFVYFAGLSTLPALPLAAMQTVMVALSLWSAQRCEILLDAHDAKPIVIDEIVCVPLALWPLWQLSFVPWWLWAALFVCYRIFDLIKPFPAGRLQDLPGGLGVVADDAMASLYMGGALFALLAWWRP